MTAAMAAAERMAEMILSMAIPILDTHDLGSRPPGRRFKTSQRFAPLTGDGLKGCACQP